MILTFATVQRICVGRLGSHRSGIGVMSVPRNHPLETGNQTVGGGESLVYEPTLKV